MLIAEKKHGAYHGRCGRCEDKTDCSEHAHEMVKLDCALTYIHEQCKKMSIDFNYSYCKGKIDEFGFILKQFLGASSKKGEQEAWKI